MRLRDVRIVFKRLSYGIEKMFRKVDEVVDEDFDKMASNFRIVQRSIGKVLLGVDRYKDSVDKFVNSKMALERAINGLFDYSFSNYMDYGQFVRDGCTDIPKEPENGFLKLRDANTQAPNTYIKDFSLIKNKLLNEVHISLYTKVIFPLKNLETMSKAVSCHIKQRNFRLVSYNSSKLSSEVLKAKAAKNPKYERRVASVEKILSAHKDEYERANRLLKAELPIFTGIVYKLLYVYFNVFHEVSGFLYSELFQLAKRETGDLSFPSVLSELEHKREYVNGLMTDLGHNKPQKTEMSNHIYQQVSSESSQENCSQGDGFAREKAIAIHPYASEEPNDLSLRPGNVIEVITKTQNRKDLWSGRLNGTIGSFPANCVKLL